MTFAATEGGVQKLGGLSSQRALYTHIHHESGCGDEELKLLFYFTLLQQAAGSGLHLAEIAMLCVQ